MIKIFGASTDWKYLQPHFCILAIATTIAALHLSLIHRTNNQELLMTCLLIWAVVGSLISEKINEPRCKQTGYGSRPAPEPEDSDCSLSSSPQSDGESTRTRLKIVTLSSGMVPTAIGIIILAGLIFRCSYLPTSRMFLHLMPFLGFLALILVVIGWQGLRVYRWELLIFLILAINPILEMLLLAGGLSQVTAIAGSGLLQYLGFPVTRQSTYIYLFNNQVEVYALCSGVHSILQMLNISVLFVAMFLPKGRIKQIACVGIGILLGFVTNAIRVALMVLLFVFSSRSAFDFWHEGQGSFIFSMIAVVLFGIGCWFAFLKPVPASSTPGGQSNG